MSEKKRSIEQITGLRGVIAFQIAYVLHWAVLFNILPDFNSSLIADIFGGTCGVVVYAPNVFFIMSGYLIHKSYNGKIGNREITFGRYILPKMKKMYPLVIVTAFITWIMQNAGKRMFGEYPVYAEGGTIRNSGLSLILSFLGLQSGYISDGDRMSVNGPAWFVSVLFLCYMIYYALTAIFKEKWMQNLSYGFFIVFGIWLMLDAPNIPLLYVINGRGYFSFFCGVLMQEFVAHLDAEEGEPKKKNLKMVIYIIMVVLFVYSFYECCINISDGLYDNLILSVLFFPSMVYLVIHGYVLSWILSRKCFVLLGKMSMSIFLCNFPTDVAIRLCDLCFGWNLDYGNPWIWLLHIIISMIIVVIFHLIFEVSWKKRN